MTGPFVSIVVPAFNAAWSIGDTIHSIQAQSCADFELIIINDGSTDNLMEELAPLVAEDPRLRVVMRKNDGLASGRNLGLRESRAEFIAFIDADDVWHPKFLEEMTAALRSNPDAPFAYAFSHRFDADNRIIPAPTWTHLPRHDFSGLLELNSVGSGSAALFRKAAVVRAGGYDESLRVRTKQGAEDWKLCLRLAKIHPPVLVPKYLVGYRLVAESMSQSDPARQLRAVHAVMDDIRMEYPQTPARHFANARTLMNGWLLTAFWRQRDFRTIARLLVESYVLNPFWFLSRDLRTIHKQKIMSILWDRRERKPLADYEEDGVRPFAFLKPR